MPPKSGTDGKKGGKQPHKTQTRVRPTQRSVEAKQFSTVRLPRSNEVTVNTSAIHDSEVYNASQQFLNATPGFDPISSDGMFTVITNSKYWPPVPLEKLLESAPPELLGKVHASAEGNDDASEGSGDSDDDLNRSASGSSDEDDDTPKAADSSSAGKDKAKGTRGDKDKAAGGALTKAERIKQILTSDGAMDMYDRRDDEAKAKKMLSKAQKVAGELSHPRGKAPVNTKQKFDDSDSD